MPSSTACRDENLVTRAQAGERSAFNELVRKYRQRILRVSIRYTRNRSDAEDAVQNTFLNAFSGLGRFRGEASFYSWLHRIAINCAKTIVALRKRDDRVFSSSTHDDERGDMQRGYIIRDLDTPEDLAFTEEMCFAVDEAMQDLNEEQRTAIILRELQGLSYSQMASAMSCPLGTVRSRVFRAREAIGKQLRRLREDDYRVRAEPRVA
jgi:RNA polymerase sigma-70 factor, ECF subfamily